MDTKVKILILSNSKAYLTGLKSLLDDSKFEVFSLSLTTTIDQMTNIPADIIAIDIENTDLSNSDFLQKIKSNSAFLTIPILAITSDINTESISSLVESGADAFCTKDSIRHTFMPQLQALLKFKHGPSKNKPATLIDESMQLLVSGCKHDFGNALTILSGMVSKLCKNHPDIKNDPTIGNIQNTVERFKKIYKKLNEIQNHEKQHKEPLILPAPSMQKVS